MTKRTIYNQVIKINKLYLSGRVDEELFYLIRSKLITYITLVEKIK